MSNDAYQVHYRTHVIPFPLAGQCAYVLDYDYETELWSPSGPFLVAGIMIKAVDQSVPGRVCKEDVGDGRSIYEVEPADSRIDERRTLEWSTVHFIVIRPDCFQSEIIVDNSEIAFSKSAAMAEATRRIEAGVKYRIVLEDRSDEK